MIPARKGPKGDKGDTGDIGPPGPAGTVETYERMTNVSISSSLFGTEGRPRSREDIDAASGSLVSPEQFVESNAASGDVQERDEGQLFEDGLQSLYRSLELTPERRAELGTALEETLDAVWPEYIALLKSPDPDTDVLRRRYCAKVQTILTPEEMARLRCRQ